MGMLVLGRDPTQPPLDPSDVLSWVRSALSLTPLSLDREQDCGPHCDKPGDQLVAACAQAGCCRLSDRQSLLQTPPAPDIFWKCHLSLFLPINKGQ